MSLLPYILSELHDLSAAMDDAPRRAPRSASRYGGDVTDLLDDLMLYHPSSRPSPSTLRLVDSPALHHHVLLRPRQLRRQLSAPVRHHHKGRKAVERNQGEDKNAFAVNVDVQQFRPEELSVQVLKDEGFVVVEGNHEERPDEHGYVRRQFTRRYKLPDGVDPDTVTSRLSSDGVLQVTAPKKEALPAPQEKVRHVAITHTDQPAAPGLNVAEDEDKETEEKGDKAVDKAVEERMEQ